MLTVIAGELVDALEVLGRTLGSFDSAGTSLREVPATLKVTPLIKATNFSSAAASSLLSVPALACSRREGRFDAEVSARFHCARQPDA